MPARRPGLPSLLPQSPWIRLAALLWLLACLAGAPAGATLHLLTHASDPAAAREDPSAPHKTDGCELCAAWSELGCALPAVAPHVPEPAVHPPSLPAPVHVPAAAVPVRWFHPRAPPRQA